MWIRVMIHWALTASLSVSAASAQEGDRAPDSSSVLHACRFGPDRMLVAFRDKSIRCLDARDGVTPVNLPGEEGESTDGWEAGWFARCESPATHVTASPDLRSVAAHLSDGSDWVWPNVELYRTQEPVRLPPKDETDPSLQFDFWLSFTVCPIQWSHDGQFLLTHRPDGVRWWSREGQLLHDFKPATGVLFSPVENLVALHSGKTLTLVRPDGESIQVDCPGGLGAIDFSPDGKRIAVGGSKSRLTIVEVATGTILLSKTIEGVDTGFQRPPENFKFNDLKWSPHGEWIGLVLGKGCLPAIVSAKEGRLIKAIPFQGGRMHEPFLCRWAPDNRMVVGYKETLVVDPLGAREDLRWPALHYQLFPVGDGSQVVVLTGGAPRMSRYDLKTGAILWARD